MKTGFKHLCYFLLIAMLLSIAASPAYAATTGRNGAFSYSMRGNGTLTITKFDWTSYQKNTDIVIPQMIDGYTVTAIGDLAFSHGDIVVGDGVPELPDRKYKAEDAVLIIPNTVTTVGTKAFFNSGIGRVNIPASVSSIGVAAFCTGCLKNATVDRGNERYASIDGALYDKKGKELLAFALDATAVPEGITALGEFSCMNYGNDNNNRDFSKRAKNLFPASLQTIKDFAIWDSCLTSGSDKVVIKALTIGKYAFARSLLMGTFSFPASVEIDVGTFCGIDLYSKIYLNNLKEIPERAFAYAKRAIAPCGVYLPISVTKIGKEAYMESEIWLSGGGVHPQIIEDRAFKGAADAAVDDEYLEKIEYIGEEAFQAKRYYEEMKIPASCTYIGDNAFYKKVKLLVEPGSYAESWACDNGYEYDNGIEQDLSWLGQN